MIVVAIIALLASIAVPGFLRARKRSQASRIINDLRLIDSAVDMYAIENNKSTGNPVVVTDWTKYLKPGTNLYSPATIFWAPHTALSRWIHFPECQPPARTRSRTWPTTSSGRPTIELIAVCSPMLPVRVADSQGMSHRCNLFPIPQAQASGAKSSHPPRLLITSHQTSLRETAS